MVLAISFAFPDLGLYQEMASSVYQRANSSSAIGQLIIRGYGLAPAPFFICEHDLVEVHIHGFSSVIELFKQPFRQFV